MVEGEDEDRRYQPALDPHQMTIGMVLDRIDEQGTEEFLQAPSEEMSAFWERYKKLKAKEDVLDEVMINELMS